MVPGVGVGVGGAVIIGVGVIVGGGVGVFVFVGVGLVPGAASTDEATMALATHIATQNCQLAFDDIGSSFSESLVQVPMFLFHCGLLVSLQGDDDAIDCSRGASEIYLVFRLEKTFGMVPRGAGLFGLHEDFKVST